MLDSSLITYSVKHCLAYWLLTMWNILVWGCGCPALTCMEGHCWCSLTWLQLSRQLACLPMCAVLCLCSNSVWNVFQGRHEPSRKMLLLMIFLQVGASVLTLNNNVWEEDTRLVYYWSDDISEMGAETALREGAVQVLRAQKNSVAGSLLHCTSCHKQAALMPSPFRPSGCCSSSQLIWLVCSQEKTEVSSVCVMYLWQPIQAASVAKGEATNQDVKIVCSYSGILK